MTMGFAKEVAAPECLHRDNWGLEVYGDHLFRTCFACGTVFMLTEIEGQYLAWERVLEPEETRDVSDLPEEMHALRGDKGERQVLPKPATKRRTPSVVRGVREEGGEGALPEKKAKSKRRPRQDHLEVLQPVQVREVAE